MFADGYSIDIVPAMHPPIGYGFQEKTFIAFN